MYRRFFLAVVNSAVAQLFQFLSFGLALYFLSAKDLGLYSLALGFQTGLALLLSCGLRQVCTLDYFHLAGEERRCFVGHLQGAYLLFALPIVLLLLLGMRVMVQVFFLNQATPMLAVAAISNAFLLFYADFVWQILSYQQALGILFVLRVSTHLLALLGASLGLWYGGNVAVIVWAQCAALLVQALVGLWYLQSPVLFPGIRVAVRFCMRGLAFMPSLFASWALAGVLRWLVALNFGIEVAAQYALLEGAALVVSSLTLLPLGMSYVPQTLEYFAQFPAHAAAYDRRARHILLVMLVVGILLLYLGFWLCTPVLLVVVPLQYHAVLPLVPVRLLSVLFLAGSYVTTCYIQAQKRVWFLVLSLVLTACAAVSLAVLASDLTGVVWALCCAHMGYVAATYGYAVWLHRRYRERVHDDAMRAAIRADSHTAMPSAPEPLPQEAGQPHSSNILKNEDDFQDTHS